MTHHQRALSSLNIAGSGLDRRGDKCNDLQITILLTQGVHRFVGFIRLWRPKGGGTPHIDG